MKLVDQSKCWFVVRSQVRQEDRAARSIQQAGFDVYLPTMRFEKKHRRNNTYSEVEKPLMVGYLFVGFSTFARHFEKVRKCDGVYDFVKVMGEPIQVQGREVASIQTAEMEMAFDDTRAARIHRGEEERTRKLTLKKQFPRGLSVRVADEKNPFADFTAVVEEVTRSGSVKALVDLFGRLVAVEFHAGQLTPAA